MAKKHNIALIGARGAGKSRISRKLSRAGGWPVFSIDTLISYEAGGTSIAKIVEKDGWPGFRNQEYKVLHKVCNMNEIIIDCGGGILVEAPKNESKSETYSERKAAALIQSARIIYVKRDIDWLIKKAAKKSHERPDLGGVYAKLLERRLPWYESAADLILDMNEVDTSEAIEILMNYLE